MIDFTTDALSHAPLHTSSERLYRIYHRSNTKPPHEFNPYIHTETSCCALHLPASARQVIAFRKPVNETEGVILGKADQLIEQGNNLRISV